MDLLVHTDYNHDIMLHLLIKSEWNLTLFETSSTLLLAWFPSQSKLLMTDIMDMFNVMKHSSRCVIAMNRNITLHKGRVPVNLVFVQSNGMTFDGMRIKLIPSLHVTNKSEWMSLNYAFSYDVISSYILQYCGIG